MKITLKWLNKNDACNDCIEWWKNQDETDAIAVIRSLLKSDKFNWANWMITRIFTKHQMVKYAIFASKQVVDLYPNDKRPRKAIAAARRVLRNDNKNTRATADVVAMSASWAARVSKDSTEEAVAMSASWAARVAVESSASDAARVATESAASAAVYAAGTVTNKDDIEIKIIDYGISLLECKNG